MKKIINFFKKIKPSKRKVIQLYSALLHNAHIKGFVTGSIFAGELKNVCAPGLNCYSCPGATFACPLGSIQNALYESKTKFPTYVFGIVLLYCIILGRTICGFLCPAGLLQELLYKIKTPKLKKNKVTRILSYTKYVLLFVLVIGIPLMYTFQANSLPVPGFCKYVCPIGTFEGGVFLLIPSSNSSYFGMLGGLFSWKFLILLIFIIASIFIFRFFCRFLCPLGALYGIFNKLSILGVKVNKDKCTNCNACVNYCKMDVKVVGDHECINCGECISVCHTNAIKWKSIGDLIKRDLANENNAESQLQTNNAISDADVISNESPLKKIKRNRIFKIVTASLLTIILVVTLVFTNVNFAKNIYVQNSIVDEFSTNLYNNEKFNIKNNNSAATMLYFYEEFDRDIINEINSIYDETQDVTVVLISKYDNKDEFSKYVNEEFSDSKILFGYDSVNQTEILNFTETIVLPYIVILDQSNKVIVSANDKYNEQYYNKYIYSLVNGFSIGNEVGDKCIDQDIKLISDDSVININNFSDKIIIINFWYSSCAPCLKELPYFQKIQQEYKNDVLVIAVSSYEWYKELETDKTIAITKTYPDLLFAYDNKGETYMNALFKTGSDAYPKTIILDRGCFVSAIYEGSVTEADLQNEVNKLLS